MEATQPSRRRHNGAADAVHHSIARPAAPTMAPMRTTSVTAAATAPAIPIQRRLSGLDCERIAPSRQEGSARRPAFRDLRAN
jgi:hypothetical protein